MTVSNLTDLHPDVQRLVEIRQGLRNAKADLKKSKSWQDALRIQIIQQNIKSLEKELRPCLISLDRTTKDEIVPPSSPSTALPLGRVKVKWRKHLKTKATN